jgi:hypothetical protein
MELYIICILPGKGRKKLRRVKKSTRIEQPEMPASE